MAIPWKPAKTAFTDWTRLARSDGDIVSDWVTCGDCAPLLEKKVMIKTQKCVISRNGAWSLSTDNQRSWLFTSPPTPPFVVAISDSMRQHVLWPARVTQHQDSLWVQFGRRSLHIDRALLMEAKDWCREAAEIGREHNLKVSPHHPFMALDRNIQNPWHGVMRRDFESIAEGHQRLKSLLGSIVGELGDGELWGLAHIAKMKPVTPEATPIDFSILS